MDGSIILISDDEMFSQAFQKKLVLLRSDDNTVVSDFDNAVNNVKIYRPKLILIHDKSDKVIDLIKEFRKDFSSCIILISDSQKQILDAYDAGADDFISPDAKDFEIVLRIVNNLKHNSVKLSGFRNSRLLEQNSVIDELTGIYKYNFAKQVIENYIDDNLLDEGIFFAVAPAQKSKPMFSVEAMAEALRTSLRADDIVTFGKGVNFYVLLGGANFNGAVTVFNRIKENYNNEICAGFTDISGKSFSKIESEAVKAISEAYSSKVEFCFSQGKEETLDEWLVDENLHEKNYKIFRQMFNKKLEKVITPVFYRLQKSYEEKLFETEIEQFVSSEQCLFKLINPKQTSSLSILYPGFAKIIINIVHEGLNSPENREIHLPLTKVSQRELVNIIEDFIKDFKNTI